MNKKTNYLRTDEKGAVLILIALLGTLLLMFVALAVDMSIANNARAAADQYARLAALSAIESYFAHMKDSNGEPLSHQERVNFAIERANEFSSSNHVIQTKSANTIELYSQNSSADSVTVEPGKWFYKHPAGGSAECENSGQPPCFRPLKQDENANAMRIKGSFYESYTSGFGHLLNVSSISDRVTTIASVVPRHACFLVDLSPSMIRGTHLKRSYLEQQSPKPYPASVVSMTPEEEAKQKEAALGFGRMFGFFRAKDNLGLTQVTNYSDEAYYCDSEEMALRGLWTEPDIQLQECMFRVLADHHPLRKLESEDGQAKDYAAVDMMIGTGSHRTKRHYASDYERMMVFGDEDYNAEFGEHHPPPTAPDQPSYETGGRLWTRVDAYTDGTYQGAEPLRTVFHGLHEAIRTFQQRAVSGDKVCLIFYDQDLAWPRIVKLTEDFDYLLKITDFDNRENFPPDDCHGNDENDCNGPLDLIGGGNYYHAAGLTKIIRHRLFPSTSAHTNAIAALTEATRQLAEGQAEGVPTSDFIVMIGDGMTDCPPAPAVCSNEYRAYKESVAGLSEVVKQYLNPRGVPLHTILVGDHVAPHSVALKNPATGKCYTSSEARTSNDPKAHWVIGGDADGNPLTTKAAGDAAWEKADPNRADFEPFYQANADMYDLVNATKGIWAPLRPPTGKIGNVCPPLACDNIPRRVLTDPNCLSEEQQINSYIDQMIGTNPYVLVDLK